jgi:golgi-associated PDZ and coiled-coil motif-containing protein
MSSVVVASFRWLDSLEKEFDKACVDVDLLLNEILADADNGDFSDEHLSDFADNVKDKFRVMASSWAQLVHKSQTIFQVNCKLEAQLVNMRAELTEAKAFKKASEKELEKLMIELHTAQLQIQKLKSNPNASANYSNSNATNQTSQSELSSADLIQKRLEEEMEKRFSITSNELLSRALLEETLSEYKKENDSLKTQLVNLNSEIFGARLASKYLDKELAGRIQQIQLFGKNLKTEEHERLWNQLEAEIHLHRHKTIIKACRNKRLKQMNKIATAAAAEAAAHATDSSGAACAKLIKSLKEYDKTDLEYLRKNKLVGRVRNVALKRTNNEGLGMSITGGREHGVPIIISEIHENGPAAKSGQLFVGDALLMVNNFDLKEAMHSEAVKTLSNLEGDVLLQVVFIADEQNDSDADTLSTSDINYPFVDETDILDKRLVESSQNNNLDAESLAQRKESVDDDASSATSNLLKQNIQKKK